MARWRDAGPIYDIADQFRQRCLRDGRSLLWPDRPAWTVENIDALWDAFIKNPILGNESFFEKWQKQLAGLSDDVHRVAADTVVVYALVPYPGSMGPVAKRNAVDEVVSWRLAQTDPPDMSVLVPAFETGFASPGTYYMTGRPWQIAYILAFARDMLANDTDPDEISVVRRAAEAALMREPRAKSMRNALLHLMLPDRFERIVSDDHKHRIIKAFAADAGNADDIDENLLSIRRALEARSGNPDLDFYDPDIRPMWDAHVEDPKVLAVRKAVESFCPDPDVRHACLTLLADSIDLAHAESSRSWSLNYRSDQKGLRFSVGKTEAIFIGAKHFYFLIDRDLVSDEFEPAVQNVVEGTYEIGAKYRSAPFAYGVNIPATALNAILPLVEEPQRSFIKRAAQAAPVTHYRYAHKPEVVEYLRRELGRGLPDPAGINKVTPPPSLDDLADATHMDRADLEELRDLLEDKRQIVLEGPPGSGKTFVADRFARWFVGAAPDGGHDERVEVVQFHQSYGYEDFVQGIRPMTVDGVLQYRVVPGLFTRLCARAAANPDERFVLLIDEINRGNLSRIFGELLLLLEYRDKRVRLPYGSGGEVHGEDVLEIPSNLFLIGTMNSTDRSLALIDYALRRRFYFYHLLPTERGEAPVLRRWLAQHDGMDDADRERVHRAFVALNERVERHLGPDFQVGHSYFMRDDIHTQTGMDRVWRRAVRPLLEEYLHGARDRDAVLCEFDPEHLLQTAVEAASSDRV